MVSIQKVSLYKSVPHRCKQVSPDIILPRVVSVRDPVPIHLKDFDGWDLIVLKPVVEVEIGTE